MTIKEKNELLEKLRTLHAQAERCEIKCIENGRDEDAALISALCEQLRASSDALLRGIYREWIGGTEALARLLDHTNEEVDTCIRERGSDPGWPRRVEKIAGYIEEIVGAAGSIVLV